jgi:hypothetical protein
VNEDCSCNAEKKKTEMGRWAFTYKGTLAVLTLLKKSQIS